MDGLLVPILVYEPPMVSEVNRSLSTVNSRIYPSFRLYPSVWVFTKVSYTPPLSFIALTWDKIYTPREGYVYMPYGGSFWPKHRPNGEAKLCLFSKTVLWNRFILRSPPFWTDLCISVVFRSKPEHQNTYQYWLFLVLIIAVSLDICNNVLTLQHLVVAPAWNVVTPDDLWSHRITVFAGATTVFCKRDHLNLNSRRHQNNLRHNLVN